MVPSLMNSVTVQWVKSQHGSLKPRTQLEFMATNQSQLETTFQPMATSQEAKFGKFAAKSLDTEGNLK